MALKETPGLKLSDDCVATVCAALLRLSLGCVRGIAAPVTLCDGMFVALNGKSESHMEVSAAYPEPQQLEKYVGSVV